MKNQIKRVKFVKLISKIISLFPFIITFAAVFISTYYILYTNINVLMNNSETVSKWREIISLMLPLFIELIVSGILAAFKFYKKIFNLYKALEYKLYLLFSNAKISYFIKCKFINLFNRNNLLAYDSQSDVISAFIDNIDEHKNKFFYIFGDNNSGKTSMISLLCERIVSDKKYFSLLDGKIMYICKSFNDQQIQKFIDEYLRNKYSNCYIIIDDIGQFSLKSQRKLWDSIISPLIKNGISYSKLLIIITDYANSYLKNKLSNYNNGLKVKKFQIINDSIDHYEPEKKINTVLDNYNITNKKVIKWIDCVCKSNGLKLINTLHNENKITKTKILFICFIVASRYSKIVDIKLIKKMFTGLGYSSISFNVLLLYLLNKSAFVFFPFLKDHVYINENVTEFYLSLYRKSECYLEILKQFEIYNNFENNDEERWLLNCEKSLLLNINDKAKQDLLFAKAFNSGNYKFLLEELNKLICVFNKSNEMFCKELGYLNEKNGYRNLAIDYLKKYISQSKDISEIAQTRLLLFEIEHHYNQDVSKIKNITQFKDPFLSLQAEYWLEHIKIEKGEFNYNRLLDIIDKYNNIRGCEDKLNYFHILRRMYSDLARTYFLNGEINKNTFSNFKYKMVTSSLRNNHVEFDEFFKLLTKAHYIHYDMIFQLGFYGRFKHDCDDEFGSNPNLEDVTYQAIKEYSECENNFKNNGDKAWKTIQIRKNELKLSLAIQYIKIIDELNTLKEEFISNKNELHLAFINCILCKAYFLDYYINYNEFADTNTLAECRGLLEKANDIYNKFGNDFGQYRIKFISTFLDYYEDIQNDLSSAIDNLKGNLRKIENENYIREYEIINSILNSPNVNTDLIAKFFKFYPIILQ